MISYDKATVILLIIAGVVLLTTSVLSMTQSTLAIEHTEENYNQFVSAEIETDICAVPDGYSDELWVQHMSHHPDRYVGCL